MKCVIDTNILIAALIKDGKTRQLICDERLKLILPETSFVEIKKYASHICTKSRTSHEEMTKLLDKLIMHMKIIPTHQMKRELYVAMGLLKNIDVKDAPFVAACLYFSDAILWSNDRRLKQVKSITVLNTEEIIERI